MDGPKEQAVRAQQEAEAHEQLSKDILDLQALMQNLANLVQVQHDAVDSIEEHIENAEEYLNCGEKDLKQAAKHKVASYPLMGALFGAAVAGGPVGMIIGVKMAVVAAVGGGLLGVFGGKFMRNKADEDGEKSSADGS